MAGLKVTLLLTSGRTKNYSPIDSDKNKSNSLIERDRTKSNYLIDIGRTKRNSLIDSGRAKSPYARLRGAESVLMSPEWMENSKLSMK